MGGAPGGGGLTNVGGLAISLQGKTDGFESAMSSARSEVDQTEGSMQSVEDSAINLRGAFLAAAGATTALTAALGGLVRAGAPVEATFSTVEVLSGATADQMDRMREMSSQLGAEMPLTMTEIADSFEQLTRRGLEVEEALASVDAVSQLAVASGLDMGRAAAIATNAMNAFQLEAEQVQSVVDGMAGAAANSAADVEYLGDAMRYAASSANQLGVSVTELNAAAATLADTGVVGTQAGTGMDAVMRSLSSPTNQATEAFEELGLAVEDFYDEEGNLKSFVDVADTLGDAMEDLDPRERQDALQRAFGDQGARAIGPMVNQTDSLRENLQAISESQVAGGLAALEGITDDELEAREAMLGFNLETEGSTQELLEQFMDEAESEEDLAFMLEAGLALEPGAAEAFANQVAEGDASTAELAESLDDATTSADLAAAAMDNVQGQLTYLRGSASALAYEMFRGAEPALSAFLDVGMAIVDGIGEMPWLLRGIGAALSVATFAAAGLTAALGVLYAQQLAVTVAGSSAMTTLYGLATANYTVAGSATAAAGGLRAAAVAARGLMVAMGPVGWAFLAASAAFAIFQSGVLGGIAEWLGLGAEAEMVASALGSTFSWLGGMLGSAASGTWSLISGFGRLLGIFVRILALPIVLPISILGATLRRTGEAASAFSDTMSTAASVVGTLIRTFAMLSPPGLVLWFARAAMQGDGLINTLGSLSDAPDAVRDAFMEAIDPLVRFHDWITSIIDLVPQLADVPIIGTLVSGMDDDTGMLEAGAEAATGAIASYLPSSDAERGPLANLTERGAALPQTLTQGIEQGGSVLPGSAAGMVGQLTGTASPQMPMAPPTPIGGGGGGAATAGGGTQQAGGTGTNVTVNAEVRFEGSSGSGGLSEERVERIAERKTGELAEEINQERRKMAEGR
jgi:TP901 family phage tail tape measure protein